MKNFRAMLLTAVVLLVGTLAAQTCMAGEGAAATSIIPDSQLNAYIEVTKALSSNPSMSNEEMDALLAKHELSKEQFDSIAKQVQSDSELKAKVDAQLSQGAAIQEEAPAVKTKLKETDPEPSVD